MSDRYDYAAGTIAIMLSMLQAKFTDTEIKRLLTRKRISAALKILKS
ncbi:MAG: hypothetical protein N0C84_05940 [Candidatus Thiodiazotropha taylori]|uniref:Uncharacterized protein n=1 Tax=Candidatus Thiodiazotropha taylori TaxID=2792791 RepID=A0A9E4KAI5_9GAMM|nr:hypothetical protein [Candidatus Thiodiazotropha taylori]MCW4255995.1 hypothetical protein [Candidatus Thiodiazotropha taylori]